jgi:hypothetical protein
MSYRNGKHEVGRKESSCKRHKCSVSGMSMQRIVQIWWPLAGSWLLMGIEQPALNAIVARLADPEINLAAYGGITFPLAMIIAGPITMLLAASTALNRDWESYCNLRRFMLHAGTLLTMLHGLVVFTPLFYVVVGGLIGAPSAIFEPARLGLMIMTPWPWTIAYRRFYQGVLIRFGHSRAVGLGTLIRLSADALVLAAGYLIATIPGVIVATSALITGVVSEAIYIGLRVRPVLRDQLKWAAPVEEALTFRTFLAFYAPLAMTTMLNTLVRPVVSAALSRMPYALESLAVWPVVFGLVFMLRSLGIAYNEIVITLLDEPGAAYSLRRFTALLATLTSALLLIMAATPLGAIWFGRVSALTPSLTALAHEGLWLVLLLPGLSVLQSWYQGCIVHSHRTRGIAETTVVFLLTTGAILGAGVIWGQITGLYVGLAAYGAGSLMQTFWLWHRSRPVMRVMNVHRAAI